MRVNVYGEELTGRIELVEKHVDNQTFYGIRFWLKFPNQDWWVHRKVDGEPDDDSSAITIWAQTRPDLARVLGRAQEVVSEVGGEQKQGRHSVDFDSSRSRRVQDTPQA